MKNSCGVNRMKIFFKDLGLIGNSIRKLMQLLKVFRMLVGRWRFRKIILTKPTSSGDAFRHFNEDAKRIKTSGRTEAEFPKMENE